jgi:Domain of unknown function (DUF1937)
MTNNQLDTRIPVEELARLYPRKGFLYLATPYSGWPSGVDHACFVAADLAGRLVKHGLRVYCPIVHSHVIAKTAQIDPRSPVWLEMDKAFVDAAQAMLIGDLDGWRMSKGIKQELDWFVEAEKPCYLLDPKTLASKPLGYDFMAQRQQMILPNFDSDGE